MFKPVLETSSDTKRGLLADVQEASNLRGNMNQVWRYSQCRVGEFTSHMLLNFTVSSPLEEQKQRVFLLGRWYSEYFAVLCST